ncbi:MAG: hypothetical protein F4X18_10965 [Acidimicrobiia bacterium]|nr:hypothetical protein [Acidimicrobiia bacterium]
MSTDSNPTTTRGNRVLRFIAALVAVLAILTAIALLWSSEGEPTDQAAPSGTAEDASRADPAASAGELAADTASPDTGHVTEAESRSEEVSSPPASTPVPEERDCSPRIPEDFRLTEAAPGPASVEISQAAFTCAHEVGLAFATNPPAIATMSARGIRGPLLLVGGWFDDRLLTELRRLAPERIVAAGFYERTLGDALTGFTVEPVAVDWEAEVPSDGRTPDVVWLVDPAKTPSSLMALGIQIGVGVVAVEGDIRAVPAYAREMIAGATRVDLLSDFEDDIAWQLEVVRRNDEIPGGGLLMFGQGDGRRLVAIYGHPVTSALGVLGEQGPEEGVERLRSIMEGYGADGSIVVPTLEIIATVASAGAGRDGDYSSETARDVIRPWIEIAAANDVYVVLDLQPGRTDFLTQAKIYEEFLRLPHVGLALDPEWRLKPDQVHLRQIGTVDAAEINRVVEWLSAIVREEALPQKLLIVHQFRFSMITNRSLIETPPELAVLIQMDGQGSLGSKYTTWNALTLEPDADRFWWGWKNFYDEDSPTATPDQVLELTPVPVFVSFQ